MRIVHINTHDVAGGAAKVAWRLAEQQRAQGHNARLLVGFKKSTADFVETFDLNVDTARQEECRRSGLLYYEYQGSHALVDHPWVKTADIIHFHNLHGGYFNPFSITKLAQLKPVVWTLHDMQAITGHCAHSFECERWVTGCGDCPRLTVYPAITSDSSRLLLNDKKNIYTASDFNVVSPSSWLSNKIRRSILQSHPQHIIYNGVDSSIFRPSGNVDLRKKLSLSQDSLIIGCVADNGALENSWKGGEYTLSVINYITSSHSNCYFLNIGSAKKSFHPAVINIPPVRDEHELARYYSLMDIFLLTSVAENCPLVILEAMSCAIPVVAFNVGGIPELVRDGIDGCLIECRNVTGLINAIETLISDKNKIKIFGNSGRERVLKEFQMNNIVQSYNGLYQKTINARDCHEILSGSEQCAHTNTTKEPYFNYKRFDEITDIVIFDPGYAHPHSHHQTINLELYQDIASRPAKVTVLGSKRITADTLQFVTSKGMKVIPYFSSPCYVTVDDVRAPATYDLLVESFARECIDAVNSGFVKDNAHILMHTAFSFHIAGLAAALWLVGDKISGTVVCSLMFNPGARPNASKYREIAVFDELEYFRYKDALRLLHAASEKCRVKIVLATSCKSYQQIYQTLWPSHEVHIHPAIGCSQPKTPVAHGRERPKVLLFLGGAKADKGFEFAINVGIAAVQSISNADFVFHFNDRFLNGHQYASHVARLRDAGDMHKNVEIITGNLSPERYQHIVCSSTIICLLYDPAHYGFKTSGIFWDALRCPDIRFIVTKGTWIALELAELRLPHTEVDYLDVSSTVTAVSRVLASTPVLVNDNNNVDAEYLDLLTGSFPNWLLGKLISSGTTATSTRVSVADVHTVTNGIPHMSYAQGAKITDIILTNKFTSILELGFRHGVSTCYMAGALSVLGEGHITTIDLIGAHNASPNIEQLLASLGLSSFVTIYYEPTSYIWRLMKMIETVPQPQFDFCYIDGAHNWATDGFAFFLVDKLLKPGGLIIFDDLDWTYSTSPSLKETESVKKMPHDERSTPQIRKVFELLVKAHPAYENFKEEDNWAYTWKRNS